jgi:hypothetical protein
MQNKIDCTWFYVVQNEFNIGSAICAIKRKYMQSHKHPNPNYNIATLMLENRHNNYNKFAQHNICIYIKFIYRNK